MVETELVNMSTEGFDGVTRIDRATVFGNPFLLEDDGGDYTRAESVDEYREWFSHKIITDDEFREAVEELRGKTLGCWCKPMSCHGDVILQYLHESKRPRDVCPECVGLGEYMGETSSGGPSTGLGAPRYTEHYQCETCGVKWSE